MKENTLLALQSILSTLQAFNAGLAALSHINPIITISIAAVCVGLQSFVQKAGNNLVPQRTQDNMALLATIAINKSEK